MRHRNAGVATGERLRAEGLAAGYHGQTVVEDVSLSVSAGQIIAVLGANGAGKTTTLRALSGSLGTLRGRVFLNGVETTAPLHARVRRGLAYVADDRSVFMELTVGENLRIGGTPELATDLFPELTRLWKRRVGLLSGGEQQMLAIGRAMSRRPKVLLVDELSLGLGPLVVSRLWAALRSYADGGGAVVLVEQHVRQALKTADVAYVLSRGRVALQGDARGLRMNDIEAAYLATEGV